jgi:hypothetical protein
MTKEQHHNKQWNVQDFEHYYSGKMPKAEMHALEKAALDDPFLQDALDGYAFTKTPVEDVEALRKQLQPKKEQAKIIWYKQKSTLQFLKVAAVLVLFAGLGWILFPGKGDKEVEIAAVVKTAQPKEGISDRTSGIIQLDSTQSKIAEGPQPPAGLNRTAPSAANPEFYKQNEENKMEKTSGAVAADDEDRSRTSEITAADTKDVDELKKRKREEEFFNEKIPANKTFLRDQVKGTVVDKQGQPVAFANVKVPNTNTNVATDENGKFQLSNKENNSTIPVSVHANGFEQANAAVSPSNTDNRIVLQENDKALSEVVVVGYGTTKKANRSAAPTAEKLKSAPTKYNRIQLRNGQPVDGWDDFDRSITEQMKTSRPIDTTGEVVLSFDIDNYGAASNISVVKPLCDSCDARAKRMLQNAPAMKKIKRSKKVQAVVRF